MIKSRPITNIPPGAITSKPLHLQPLSKGQANMPKNKYYEYQHYPKQVKSDADGEYLVVVDAREHWKVARKDFEKDSIAKEQFTPSASETADSEKNSEGNNLLKLKTKTV